MLILILITRREGARHLSLSCARQVANQAMAMGHRVHYYDPDLGSEGLLRHVDEPLPQLRREPHPSLYLEAIAHPCMRTIDGVFNAIYHPLTPDGCLEQLFQIKGVRILGNLHRAHTLGQERYTSNRLLDNHLPVLPDLLIRDSYNAQTLYSIQQIGDEVVIYPNKRMSEGEGVVVQTQNEILLQSQLNNYLENYQQLLIIPLVKGRYFSVGVMGDFCSRPLEITQEFTHRINQAEPVYSSQQEAGTFLPLSPEVELKLQTYAQLAHQMIESDHSSHCEFLIDEKGSLFLIDIFTRPLLLENSLFMRTLNHSNWSASSVIEKSFDLAWARPSLDGFFLLKTPPTRKPMPLASSTTLSTTPAPNSYDPSQRP